MWKKFANLCLIIVLLVSACGCQETSSHGDTTFITISAPRIIAFDSYISWDPVNYALQYDVYCNGILAETLSDTIYMYNLLEDDSEFYVVARNGENSSRPSNTVVASKGIGFTEDEILNLSNRDSFCEQIPSVVRKVVIKASMQRTVTFEATICERTRDLIFDLENVTLIGFIVTENQVFSRLIANYNVIFYVNGDSRIFGKEGWSSAIKFPDNSEKDGEPGGDGADAIIAPTVIFRGSHPISIQGGNGGNGGDGSATTTYSSKTIGKGSNGGNGGRGIVTQYMIVNMDCDDISVSVFGGVGGKKGSPGTNASIITGPLVSMMWSDIYDIGKAGKQGKGINGIVKIIKGNLER